MALKLESKQAIVAEVSAQVAEAGAIVFAEYRGLTVAEMTELRRKAREAGVYLHVIKNTLSIAPSMGPRLRASSRNSWAR